MRKVLMVNAVAGIWDPTDKFEFTGKWKCGNIRDYAETNVEFEVRIKVNCIRRWWRDIPKYDWVDSSRFVEVNVCD